MNEITTIILLALAVILVLFIGFLLVIIGLNKHDIKVTKDFLRRHGIKDG